jgi:hypothetical protein
MAEMLKLLLARLDENTKSKQQLLAKMTRMEEDSKAWREKRKAERRPTENKTRPT